MKNKTGVLLVCLMCIQQICFAQQKLRVVLDGLSHDHVNRILDKNKNGDIVIIGIAEADQLLCNEKRKGWQLPASIFYKDLKTALKEKDPDLVMVYKAPSEHLAVAETCMPLHIPVMFEKPLCFSYAEALKIEMLSKKFNTKVFTNFPSVWYTSFIELLKKKDEAGTIHKMILTGGHRGPLEIGCSKEFSGWLTNPAKNGGGAITDFGCYGASIMTELMNGKKPISVFAVARNLKPATYPGVDDDATIVLEYADGATGIIQASWSLPYTIMETEVYGRDAYLRATQIKATDSAVLQSKNEEKTKTENISIPQYKDEVEYLTVVIKDGAPDNNKLLSLQSNLIVVRILDAARKSVKEGRKILL